MANAIIDEYPGRGSELSLSLLIFPIRLLLISYYFATSGSVCLFLNRRLCLISVLTMKEHVLEWFKTIIRRRVGLKIRLTAICGGDRILVAVWR